VVGQNFGGGPGVKGTSGNGFGVAGYSTNGAGVYGDNGNSNTVGYAGSFNGRVNITGNLMANNLPGAKATQARNTGGTWIGTGAAPDQQDLDVVTVNVPSDGVLFVSGFVNLATETDLEILVDFTLRDSSNNILAGTTEEAPNCCGRRLQRTATLTWVLPVGAGSMTLKTHLFNNGTIHTSFFDHNLSVVYVPRQL
jgi:hypothetical protein